MAVAVITGSAGLIGAEAARFFAARGLDIVGIDNDMRAEFLGPKPARSGVGGASKRSLPTTGIMTSTSAIKAQSSISSSVTRQI